MSAVPIVTFTSLFPNAEMPQHGLFVAERLRRLVATGRVAATVVAPVPWFPSRAARFGEYARFARVPHEERWHDLPVRHPRYPVLPALGMNLQAASLAIATLRGIGRLQAAGQAALIDAHYFYPDGVAAAWIGARLGVPVVITARGSDVNVIARHAVPRRMMLRAALRAAAVVTVSEALRGELLRLGVPPERVRTLRNGVDLTQFSPGPPEPVERGAVDAVPGEPAVGGCAPAGRGAVRRALGLTRFTLLSVGRLVPGKGHERVVAALAQLPDCELVIVGEGPGRTTIRAAIDRLGLGDRVHLPGALPRSALVSYYRAADVLVLASAAEGMPNVVLESLACGTPVVASAVGGIPEILDASVGRILAEPTPGAIAAAVSALRARPPERGAVRRFAEQFGWEETISALTSLIETLACRLH